MVSSDRPATRLATRLSFLVAGFGIACWAPLVPFAKQRLAVDDGTLGLLLLCIGIGSVVAMLLTGPLSSRYGSKPVILAGGFGLAVILPVLSVAATPTTVALTRPNPPRIVETISVGPWRKSTSSKTAPVTLF